MGISLSAKGVKSESDLGMSKPEKGRYLMMIKEVDETMEKKDQVIVDFEVLAGNVPGQKGRVLTEYYGVSDKALPRLTRLALCVGLLQPDEVKDVTFASGKGRVLFVEVEPHSYEKDGKKTDTVRVSFMGMWSVGNPDVADLLQVDEIAAKINELRSGNANPPSNPTPNNNPPTDKGKWGNLL